MASKILSIVSSCAAFASLFGQFQARDFEEAARRIVRRPPRSFPALPSHITRELQRRGCTIPQEVFTKGASNVIRGEFAKRGQTDWAVLCSMKGFSSILVFWNGSEKNPAAIATMEDRIFLQSINTTDIGFSRGISAVGKDYILSHHAAYGGTKPPPIDHQGINDAFIEKASVVWYFQNGKWLKLTGAD
ncbi:MAG: hypothetical protein U0Q18_26890 [Bryobacteraceae bacterium]